MLRINWKAQNFGLVGYNVYPTLNHLRKEVKESLDLECKTMSAQIGEKVHYEVVRM